MTVNSNSSSGFTKAVFSPSFSSIDTCKLREQKSIAEKYFVPRSQFRVLQVHGRRYTSFFFVVFSDVCSRHKTYKFRHACGTALLVRTVGLRMTVLRLSRESSRCSSRMRPPWLVVFRRKTSYRILVLLRDQRLVDSYRRLKVVKSTTQRI